MAIIFPGSGNTVTIHDDLIIGSGDPSVIDTIYGDSSGTLSTGSAGNDVIFGVDGFDNLRGDAAILDGASDTAFARGGNDIINVGASGTGSNDARGDADTIQGFGAGGNDLLLGSEQSDELRGDARTMQDSAHGGADWLWGAGGNDSLTGDARDMKGASVGGDDHLFGGDGDDTLRGDARMMSDTATGGRDWLDGGKGNDVLWGDAENMAAGNQGGNDVLTGGQGHDTFEFAGHFGHDLVLDLDQGDHGPTGEQLVFKNTSAVGESFDAHGNLVLAVDDGTPAHILSTVTLLDVHQALAGAQSGTDFIVG